MNAIGIITVEWLDEKKGYDLFGMRIIMDN
jgi:hypothetical protein